jgi:hypothetical protein
LEDLSLALCSSRRTWAKGFAKIAIDTIIEANCLIWSKSERHGKINAQTRIINTRSPVPMPNSRYVLKIKF